MIPIVRSNKIRKKEIPGCSSFFHELQVTHLCCSFVERTLTICILQHAISSSGQPARMEQNTFELSTSQNTFYCVLCYKAQISVAISLFTTCIITYKDQLLLLVL